jgi:hypothetical protein
MRRNSELTVENR